MSDYCTEDGCHELATTERFEGMLHEDVVVMRTCSEHGPEWLRG